MQLEDTGFFPVKPHRRCCGLRTLLSAPKTQFTYSFCYAIVFYFILSPSIILGIVVRHLLNRL